MRLVQKGRLVLTDRDQIRTLLADLAADRAELVAEAAEMGAGGTVKIKTIKDNYFLAEIDRLPIDAHSVPLSSWRLIANLDGAQMCITTVSLARVDTQMFALMIPDEVVSGMGRRHYRVMAVGHENFQVLLQSETGTDQADVVEASFSGLKAKLLKPGESLLRTNMLVHLTGRQRGIMFREPAIVAWRQKDAIGVSLIENPGECLDDRPWSHVVRRMAYDQFMKHLRPVNHAA